MDTSIRDRHNRRLSALKTERNPYEAEWQELNDYIVPGRYRGGEGRRADAKGKNANGKIVDNSPKMSHRVAQSGMQAGLTSPTRPWMRYSTDDEELKEFGPVKDYLFQATSKARDKLSVSNIYNCLHSGYGDELLLGQFAMILTKKNGSLSAIMPPAGQYWLAQSDNSKRVDTLYRRVWMTVEQVVGRFVADTNDRRKMDWSKVSVTVHNCWDNSRYDEYVEVYHAIEPRKDRDPRKLTRSNKPFMSNYWEAGGPAGTMLEISGFDRNPIIAPRWEVLGEDVYATYCPGTDALPDVKMLQTEQKWKGQGIEHQVRPAMVAPTALRNRRNSSLPGTVTYVDEADANKAYRRAFDVNIGLNELREDIESVNRRVDRAFYADLFQAITNMQGIQPKNVFELTQRKEEQLQQLGPTVERQHHELIMPLADWVFYALDDDNELPPPPPELEGRDLRVDNISTLAQAQLAVQTGSIERLWSFAGSISGANPEALDKIDADQSIDEYAGAIGAMPTIVRSDDKVAEIRARRQQQQQAAQAAESAATLAPAAKQGAEAAQVLQDINQNGGTTDLLSRLGIAG